MTTLTRTPHSHGRRAIGAPIIAAMAMLACGTFASANAKEAPPPYDYGPPPEWTHYKAMGEEAVRGLLVDPDSARFEWPRGYHQGGWKPLLERRAYGYVTCGYVNARNRMGGYAGRSAFVVVIDYDQVIYADLAKSPTDLLSDACAQAARSLMFPSPNTMPTSAVEIPKKGAPLLQSGLGLDITPIVQGAYVQSVAPGSDAERAGLKQGMIIIEVNGLALGTLGGAMLKVIEASPSPAVLTILGQGRRELFRTSPTAIGGRP